MAVNFKGRPKKISTFSLLTTFAIVAITLPIGVFFIAQQNTNLTDQRNKAGWDTVYQGCTINPNNCPTGYTCNCQNGNLCTYTACTPQSGTKAACANQGRSWCINTNNGNAYTCCSAGYRCGPNGIGCIGKKRN